MSTPSVFPRTEEAQVPVAVPARGPLRSLGGRDPIPLLALVVIGVIGSIVMIQVGGAYTGLTLSVGVGYGVVVVGMVLQLGYTHQLAFSQAMFMALGGYGVAILETKYGFSSAESVVCVIAASAVVSLLIGSVLAGVPGLALPLATLVLPLGLYVLATYSHYLGSYLGITGILPLWSGGDYASTAGRSGVVSVLFLAAAAGLVLRFIRSGVGLQLMSIATDEHLAQSIGVSLRQRRLEVFVVGSVLATIGGVIVATSQGIVSPDLVQESTEITLLVTLYVAGSRSVVAVICAALLIQYLSTANATISSNLPTIEGAVLVLVFLVEPNGVVGIVRRGWRAATNRGLLPNRLPGVPARLPEGGAR
ncbi:MAG: branched-chain amino acid ABC transporter permease [Acidimicrobiaceae bacterium]|nr:branched-chain amino acid ABC transporter permease [Acidimicrobiaceae bacterium]MBO0747344.1 branched-chain amino acid ABC transporter permease [Acidimicrobiaceae bacterium]